MQHVAALDDGVVLATERAVRGTLDGGALDVDVRQEPCRQVEVGEPLPDVPGDVGGRRDARRDDPLRERLGDDAPRQRDDVRVDLELRRGSRLEPAHGEPLRTHDPLAQTLGQHLEKALVQ